MVKQRNCCLSKKNKPKHCYYNIAMIGLRVHPRLHGYPTEFHDRSNKEQRESCLCNKDYLWILLEASLLVFLVLICSKGSQIFRASSLKKDDLSIDFQPITSEPLEEREIRRTLKNIPHVSDVKCSTFLIPPEEWNQTIEEQSKGNSSGNRLLKADDDCTNITSNWADIPVSEFERSHPIAFTIMTYKNLDRFTRLLHAIYRTSNVYCVHVDVKSSPDFKKGVSRLASCFDNVFLAKTMVPVYWGHASVLKMEMICLQELWERKITWEWAINLTGEEFPLKTNLELIHILRITRDFNDVWVDPCTEHGSNPKWYRCRWETQTKFKERWMESYLPPFYAYPFKGQVHYVLSRSMVEYILNSQVANAIYNWSLTTVISDEIFFSTLNSNFHLKAPGSNAVPLEYPLKKKPSLARLKLWKRYETWPYCTYYLREICLLSPRELPMLMTSRQLFANKFKPDHRPLGYDCLEEWYFNKIIKELQTGRVQLDLRPYYIINYKHLGL